MENKQGLALGPRLRQRDPQPLDALAALVTAQVRALAKGWRQKRWSYHRGRLEGFSCCLFGVGG